MENRRWFSDAFGNITDRPTRKGWRFFLPTFHIIGKCGGRLGPEHAAQIVREHNAHLELTPPPRKVCAGIE